MRGPALQPREGRSMNLASFSHVGGMLGTKLESGGLVCYVEKFEFYFNGS